MFCRLSVRVSAFSLEPFTLQSCPYVDYGQIQSFLRLLTSSPLNPLILSLHLVMNWQADGPSYRWSPHQQFSFVRSFFQMHFFNLFFLSFIFNLPVTTSFIQRSLFSTFRFISLFIIGIFIWWGCRFFPSYGATRTVVPLLCVWLSISESRTTFFSHILCFPLYFYRPPFFILSFFCQLSFSWLQ